MWTNVRNEVRYHGVAKDGQPVHMYFYKHKVNHFTLWLTALYVGGSRRNANRWLGRMRNNQPHITGNGSLSALILAKDILLEFASKLGMNEEIQVMWEDAKRRRAYRWLTRYKWFEAGDCYYYRNPKYYYKKGF